MAGDWIKVEHATATKPEVSMAAELLGISRREMVGLLLDYWIWLDSNLDESCNGLVTQVSRRSMEDIMHCPGFAAVLERMKWAYFDDEERVLTVVNWERHNGSTAKTRASTNKRVKRLRNAATVTEALPEKRREEKITTRSKTNTKAVAQKRSPIPAEFGLTDELKSWGKEYGDLQPYMDIFVGRNSASGKEYADWSRAFMNAVREDWYELRKPNGHRAGFESRISEQERVMENLTGGGKGRTIDAAR